MILLRIIFWVSLFLISYAYIGYGIFVKILLIFKNIFSIQKPYPAKELPEVSLIVAAYNEADCIEKKIENSLALAYPSDKLKLIFITDGSTDNTYDIISRNTKITALHENIRKGKTAALNRAMNWVKTPIVIFSDANTLLNKEAINNIVKHYQHPKIGGVAGEKKIITPDSSKAAGAGEGLYWKYESWLKKQDAALYTVVGAAGELFSVRTSLFEPLPENVILDDFVLSLQVVKKGYRFAYESAAYAMEAPSSSIREEQKRKIRICAGGFQAMVMLKSLFNIFKYPVASFQYISHRVLRWTLVPLCLPVLFILNTILVADHAGIFYSFLLAAQLVFYLLAFTGFYYANKNIKIKILYIPYYFFFMNWSVYLGFWRFIRGRQAVTWEKASRDQLITNKNVVSN